MRIWSLHPSLLDSKGLVALWRETLLAKNVLENKTRGYKFHPQLSRFKKNANPLNAINFYLQEVYFESQKRGFNFNINKINQPIFQDKISLNSEQLNYEFTHLQNKLKTRDPRKFKENNQNNSIPPHPLFTIINGEIEDWEILTNF
ncbi:MAG: hypothetical protein HXX09_02730 [Bacteroidetes bacterium]|nr:hypothetical protein [Bacteroidota bacterium]